VIVSESSLAALLLTNRLVEVDAKPLGAADYWSFLEKIPDPAALLESHDVDELLRNAVLSESESERIHKLVGAAAAFAFERERLEEEGVRLVSTFDDSFPDRLKQRLGRACPAFLTIAGPIDWLQGGGIGVVGSRDASSEALAIATSVAAVAKEHGMQVVSGLARGIDRASMSAGLENGSPVVGVPAEGIRIVAKSPEIRSRVHAGELCIASPYGPRARFTAGNAMGRNKLIYALADITLVVCSDNGSGGTWEGAKEALRKNYGIVAVWLGDGAGPGNDALVKMGATPITDLTDLTGVKRAAPATPVVQSSLF
jgi:predicted Rossmann fold nucleotide-binding protein DprA/Smf involved in DNA uptake